MTKPHVLPLQKSVAESGRQVIQTELEGLMALRESLGDVFEGAVRKILGCPGRVIVTGMGKSGHIARKIAATFTSTGTQALFLHPAEASHGDLGIVTPSDVILALSNSGETKELSDIIAYTHRHSVTLIALTQKPDSTLARQASLTLLIPNVAEACPNRLAPTTSSTMMLALGDALAMTVLEQKGFSAKDFRDFHPGGKLGQQLMRVGDLMCQGSAVPLSHIHDKMANVIMVMTEKRLGCVGILNDDGTLAGIITDGDLRRVLQKEGNLLDMEASHVMNQSPITINRDLLAADAVRLMKERQITNLFVTQDNRVPLGVIHIHDCLKAGIF